MASLASGLPLIIVLKYVVGPVPDLLLVMSYYDRVRHARQDIDCGPERYAAFCQIPLPDSVTKQRRWVFSAKLSSKPWLKELTIQGLGCQVPGPVQDFRLAPAFLPSCSTTCRLKGVGSLNACLSCVCARLPWSSGCSVLGSGSAQNKGLGPLF